MKHHDHKRNYFELFCSALLYELTNIRISIFISSEIRSVSADKRNNLFLDTNTSFEKKDLSSKIELKDAASSVRLTEISDQIYKAVSVANEAADLRSISTFI